MDTISPKERERRVSQSAASRLLNTPETADRIGTSISYLNKLRCAGGGPVFVKMGRLVRYRPEDVDAYLDARRRTSTSDTREVA
jgi:predicted DNA-binding transcriptional regulator AlpA